MESRAQATGAKTSIRYNLFSALLAFAIWGGWAYLVNRHAPGHSALISGVTQGACSFVITLIIVRAVSKLYERMPDNALRLVLPPVLTIAATGSVLALAHKLVGTDALATTIAAPLTVAFGFAIYTTIHIDRQRKATTQA